MILASPAADEDLYLVARVAAGDQDAFAQLFDLHAPPVLGLLTRLMGDRARAEEVLQDTFLQVWQQAPKYRPQLARPRAWIAMMARSRALDRLRAQTSRARREDSVYGAQGEAASPPVGTSNLERSERQRQVAAALAVLPPEQRRCIELAFFEGLTHTEISFRLDAPLGTVKSRILVGMQKLRHVLGSHP